MSKPSATRKITKRMIYRAVASSTAIETGAAVDEIEKKLKSSKDKFRSLALAD